MSNTNTEKVYVLLKDLPDLKAGAEFTHIKGTNIYDYGSGDKRKKIIQYGVTEVENNPEWFTLKQPVEDKRIEVLFFDQKQYMVGVKPKEIGYELSCNKAIPPEKYEAVKQAIEKTINGENDNPAPPTLERQDSKEDKGWEIISYKHIVLSNELCNGAIIYKSSHHFDYAHGCPNDFAIHSVRRKDDGEVFELNKVYYDEMGRALKPVKKFFEKEGVMYAQFNEGYGSNDGCLGINSLQKQPKEEPKPLFVTEDGVGVYKNGECWIYEEDYPNPYQWINCCEEGINEGFKYFSTKAAAEEYILMNKPCLSVNDINELMLHRVGGWGERESVKKSAIQLSKNKINKQ